MQSESVIKAFAIGCIVLGVSDLYSSMSGAEMSNAKYLQIIGGTKGLVALAVAAAVFLKQKWLSTAVVALFALGVVQLGLHWVLEGQWLYAGLSAIFLLVLGRFFHARAAEYQLSFNQTDVNEESEVH